MFEESGSKGYGHGKGLFVKQFVVSPMITAFREVSKEPTDQHVKFYEALARLKPAMMFIGATAVAERGRGFHDQFCLDGVQKLPAFSRLARSVQKFAPAVLQLFHAGPKALRRAGFEPVAPSSLDALGHRYGRCREASATEVEDTVQEFKAATILAVKAGFRGVEIHGGNSYLLHSFSDSRWNRRSDKWADPFELPLAIVRAVRDAVPDGCFVGYCVSPFTVRAARQRETVDILIASRLAQALCREGVDFIRIYRSRQEGSELQSRVFTSEIRRDLGNMMMIEGAGVRDEDDIQYFLDHGVDLVATGRHALEELLPDRSDNGRSWFERLSTSDGIREFFDAIAAPSVLT